MQDPLIEDIRAWQDEFTTLRRDIHMHPELAFEEHRTADIVATLLRDWGLDVTTGIARTGVVGTLRSGSGNRAIGLRADMDALPLQELNEFGHKSKTQNCMHACGHDGHTTMLLAAAKYMAQKPGFDGVVHFIFQPAEENEGGGRAMIEDGLFERFPCEAVFGMHNMPGYPVGSFAMRPGPMMASFDRFDITLRGIGAHAAMPHHGIDPIVVTSELVQSLQAIVGRNMDPLKSGVVSVTKFHAGDAYNVIPNEASIAGCTRAFQPKVRDMLEAHIERHAKGVAAAHGAEAMVSYERCYPPTVNTVDETELCAEVATKLVGAEHVNRNVVPTMGSEDFAFMLEKKPGCYIFAGNGDGEGTCMVHNPRYDFNDEVTPFGAAYWVRLAETALPAEKAA